MGRMLLLAPNRAGAATLSGGDWESALPLANLQTRRLAQVARSSSADIEDTLFAAAFPTAEIVRVVALINHNMPPGAQWRVTGAEDSGFSSVVYQSDWLPVWPAVYDSESLEWEDDNWWLGSATLDDIIGITWSTAHLVPQVAAAYWKVEID